MKFLSFPWQRPFIVKMSGDREFRFRDCWQLVNFLRNKPITIELDPDTSRPGLEELQSKVAEHPEDAMARLNLGAWLHTYRTAEEALPEYLEAITLLSNEEYPEGEARRLSARAFARRMVAKALDDLGRTEEAREQWRGCADDWQTAVPQKKYLADNGIYHEAI